ncbi:ABC transporter ATP-binding protein [Nocardioides sp. L-11A]|nr:ABC transporter ATP-binding protein [Nocardioides sp. L-11A]
MHEPDLLSVENLETQFVTREGVVPAVDRVSFTLAQGETLGIVGESGCGKSVTSLSLMRLIPSEAGQIAGGVVRFDGADILQMSEQEVRRIRGSQIAMIFQDPMTSLNPVLTVGQQIIEALRLHLKMNKADARKRAIELLEMVGIPSPELRVDDFPHRFSGGMRQRVVIALALSCNPKLILADEPTTGLDVTIQAQILRLLKRLSQEFNTACILITHDLGVVAGMAQRIHVMYAGQIVEKADTAELFANPKMPYTWGLLRSIPRLEGERRRLQPIQGSPGAPTAGRVGCRFANRCQYQRAICREQDPDLTVVPDAASGHEARCWGTQEGGWLVDHSWRDEDVDAQTTTQATEAIS